MKNRIRIILPILIMVCFILTATNTVLALHLAEHHDDENHDPEHCPICQQATINVVQAVLPTPLIVIELLVIVEDVYVVHHFVKHFKFLTPYMRAPPTIS